MNCSARVCMFTPCFLLKFVLFIFCLGYAGLCLAFPQIPSVVVPKFCSKKTRINLAIPILLERTVRRCSVLYQAGRTDVVFPSLFPSVFVFGSPPGQRVVCQDFEYNSQMLTEFAHVRIGNRYRLCRSAAGNSAINCQKEGTEPGWSQGLFERPFEVGVGLSVTSRFKLVSREAGVTTFLWQITLTVSIIYLGFFCWLFSLPGSSS